MMDFLCDPVRIERHRSYLHAIPHWIDSSAYATSLSGYGCPPRLFPLLDLPLDKESIYTDLIAEAAGWLNTPVRYLEIGVSVGKNFWVLANVLENAELFGFDWEKISPVLESRFHKKGGQEPLGEYALGTNAITYLQGNVLHTADWQLLCGRKFNLVFFDAIHQTAPLLHEFAMLESLELLDERGFCMFWDDLDFDPAGPVSSAFYEIAGRLQRRYDWPNIAIDQKLVNGWLGQHEHKHLIGIITLLP